MKTRLSHAATTGPIASLARASRARRRSRRGDRGQLGIGTWNDYRGIMTAYLVPQIGTKPLQKLSALDLNLL